VRLQTRCLAFGQWVCAVITAGVQKRDAESNACKAMETEPEIKMAETFDEVIERVLLIAEMGAVEELLALVVGVRKGEYGDD
jgi:hypothetical protein